MKFSERVLEFLRRHFAREIPEFSLPAGGPVDSSSLTLSEMVLIAIWQSRADHDGREPWELGIAQLWIKLWDVYRYECSIGALDLELDFLVRKNFLVSRTASRITGDPETDRYRRRLVGLSPRGVVFMLEKQKLADLEVLARERRAWEERKRFGIPQSKG